MLRLLSLHVQCRSVPLALTALQFAMRLTSSLSRQVIKGWDEGVMQMSLGEKAKLSLTSDYGYGAEGAGGVIPPNANLDFEVELLQIN